ncbi:SDR family oxidoreductase [Arenimonas fontis]|uniref:SDR family oxidoreductase n=1 Tax=Arenimonas fontis TaxID=2608255 RepID=A0A5B2ZGA3_9GAMM|nr:SDR family oxidoreductase [Arenimonas fontis]KAA2286092.1 SDR family oxidoreductase [Arenimonas fontis]
MELNLKGRHALVCGASEGIGRAAAEALAGLGADVTVLARRAEVLAEVAAALPRVHAGQRHGHVAADSSDGDGLRAAVSALVVGRPVQILVNNTAGPPGGSAHEAEPERYVEVFRQHLVANQILVQAVLAGMKAAGWGRIVNVISTSVKEPIANLGVSNTVRGAVAAWAKTLASELGPHGITVNNVLPGYTRTRRLEQILAERAAATGRSPEAIAQAMLATVPAGRFAEAAEVAAAIAFLASPAAAYVNGINLPVDGGRTRSL